MEPLRARNRPSGRRGHSAAAWCRATVVVACLTALPGAATAGPAAVVGPTQTWVTDGDVLAIATLGGVTYVGGDFALVGRSTGAWAEVNSSGGVRPIRAVVSGSVAEAVADGRGGWFLRGDIAAVGGAAVGKTEVVHLRSGGRLDSGWSLRTDGEIYAMARVRDRLYVGGAFARIDGAGRANLAAVDVQSGALLDWGPRVAGPPKGDPAEVYAIAPTPDGSAIYFGGFFERVDGARRRSLAAVRTDGTLLPFNPGAEYADSGDEESGAASVSVLSMDPRGRVLYAAGDFDDLAGAEREGLGAVDARTGRVRPWNPDCDGDVWAIEIAPAGSPVYVAGEFASIGGKSRRGLAAVDARRGTATLWDPGIGGAVHTIALDARRKTVVAGGEFESVGDVDRANLAVVDTRTGVATPWDVPVIGTVDVVEPAGAGGMVVGGDLESVGALRREGLAALAADGSSVTDWRPPMRGVVRTLASDPRRGRVYVGGRFSLGDSRAQRSLATLEIESGAVTAWGPTINSGVFAIAPGDGETVYVGGAFTTVDGKARRRIAALRAEDGSLLPWNVGASAVVRTLGWTGEELWVGGQFTSVGGEQRRGVASVEIATARTTGWDAGANGNVDSLRVIGESVYVAGPFTAIGGRSRKHLAALDAADGAATRWDPAPDDVVRALAVAPDGAQLIAAGDFERIAGGRRDVASFDLTTGFVTDWRPVAPFSGLAVAVGEAGWVFVGGEGALVVFHWPPPVL